MVTVDSPSVAIKPNSGYIASDNRIDKQIQQTETSSQAGASTRQETNKANHVTKAVTRNIDFDADTRALIVQTIDDHTNTVLRQYPSEVQLRIRAYFAASNIIDAQSGSFDRTS